MLLRSDDGKEFELGPETLVGREEECQVVLNEEHVSRYHAKITVTNNKVSIEDLSSKNGTYVNGKKLTEMREVGIGDEICFDQMIFRVVTPDSGSAKSTLFRSPSKIEFPANEPVKPKADALKVTDERIELTSQPEEKASPVEPAAKSIGPDAFDATNNIKPTDNPINHKSVEGKSLEDNPADNSQPGIQFDPIDEESVEKIVSLAKADSPLDSKPEKVQADIKQEASQPKPDPQKPSKHEPQNPLKQEPAGQSQPLRQPQAPEDTTRFDINQVRSRDQISRPVDDSQIQDGAFLVVLSAPLRGHEFVLSDFAANEVIVGRDEVCDIVLSDATVSNRHARFYQVGSRWCVANLGATNGVKVNGEKVDHAWLNQDDVVKLGRMEIQFSLTGVGPRGADEIAKSLFDKEKAKDKSSKLPWMVGVGFLSFILFLFSLLFFFGGF